MSKIKENTQLCLGGVGGSYIIRIYDQDLCGGWIDKGGYKTPNNYLNKNELIKDLQFNGLQIVKWTFSFFGDCYFFEVKGQYKGSVKYKKIDTKPVDFCWSV